MVWICACKRVESRLEVALMPSLVKQLDFAEQRRNILRTTSEFLTIKSCKVRWDDGLLDPRRGVLEGRSTGSSRSGARLAIDPSSDSASSRSCTSAEHHSRIASRASWRKCGAIAPMIVGIARICIREPAFAHSVALHQT